MTKQVDLTTLTGWASLSDGEHTITIKAKADGYRDSQASEGVSVTKGSTGETWVLNETPTTELQQTSIAFTSNGENFFGIRCADELGIEVGYFINSVLTSSKTVYSNVWTNTAYRTITFATAPTGDLLTWLQANGTKQGGAVTISFTIKSEGNAILGTYQAEQGMTWEQWVASDYNTGALYIDEKQYVRISGNVALSGTRSSDIIVNNAVYVAVASGGDGQ